jgi:hypothetical protein
LAFLRLGIGSQLEQGGREIRRYGRSQRRYRQPSCRRLWSQVPRQKSLPPATHFFNKAKSPVLLCVFNHALRDLIALSFAFPLSPSCTLRFTFPITQQLLLKLLDKKTA